MTKRIVMSCIHYWNSPYQVATHHIARQFAYAGWQVAYISSPITPLHLLKYFDEGVQERFYSHREQAVSESFGTGNVTSIVPFSLIAPDNQFPLNSKVVINNWTRLTRPKIADQLKSIGFSDVDILYLDNFYHAPIQHSLRYKHFVYHMADNYSGFPGYSRAFREIEEKLVSSVDRVVYPSIEMESYIDSLIPKEKNFIPNGVDLSHFEKTSSHSPRVYLKIPKPIAVYVGAIEEWFDFDLLNSAAKAHVNVSFVLIGGEKLAKAKLKKLPNIYLLGSKSRDELPPYLEHADVGMIPFNVRDYPELIGPVRPLKLLEYCAAGLPTVSTHWPEIERMNSPALLARSHKEFISKLGDVFSMTIDKQEYRNYAAQFQWDTLFKLMLAVILK